MGKIQTVSLYNQILNIIIPTWMYLPLKNKTQRFELLALKFMKGQFIAAPSEGTSNLTLSSQSLQSFYLNDDELNTYLVAYMNESNKRSIDFRQIFN